MDKSAHWALVAAVFAASIIGCGLNTGPSDEIVAGEGALPENVPASEGEPNAPSEPSGTENTPPPPGGETGGPAPTTPAPPGSKIVFVTTARVNGSIKVESDGGLLDIKIILGGGDDEEDVKTGREAADIICQSEAKKAKLTGTYLAWLSTSGEDAIKRIPDSAGGWALPTGQLIFPNRTHIAAGKGPLTPLMVHANGTWLIGSSDAWTATSETGVVASSTCNSWKSKNGMGVSGALYYTDKKWTNNASDWCSSERRLICFQKD